MVCSLFKKQLREKSVFDQKEGHSFADSIFDDAIFPDKMIWVPFIASIRFCISSLSDYSSGYWQSKLSATKHLKATSNAFVGVSSIDCNEEFKFIIHLSF